MVFQLAKIQAELLSFKYISNNSNNLKNWLLHLQIPTVVENHFVKRSFHSIWYEDFYKCNVFFIYLL